VTEWIASCASFLILFAGFLFFSDLLTPGDSKVVLWSTIGLLVGTYVVVAAFIMYDLFPHGRGPPSLCPAFAVPVSVITPYQSSPHCQRRGFMLSR